MYKKNLLFTSKIPMDDISGSSNSNNNTVSKYHSIEYYIIENTDHVRDSKEYYRYGLSISKRNNSGEIEESLVTSVSDSKSDVENLISSLCVHAVTPLSLHDVMEDFFIK